MNPSSSQFSYYLQLQWLRGKRILMDNGIVPGLAIPAAVLLFGFITFRLLDGLSYGEYIYAALGLSMTSSITDQRRKDFVQSISSRRDFIIIKFLDLMTVLLPFIIGFLSFGLILWAIGILCFVVLLSFLDIGIGIPYTLPTPFGRNPFEFIRGFRATILLVMGCYIIMGIGMSVGNFNLALSSIAGIGLLGGNYFMQPESRFYIWIHEVGPQRFILDKATLIIRQTLLLVGPMVIALCIYDWSRWLSVLLITIAALAFIIMCMLAKYMAYPSEVNVVAGLAIAVSVILPPLMIIIIPIFYIKSLRRLEQILR